MECSCVTKQFPKSKMWFLVQKGDKCTESRHQTPTPESIDNFDNEMLEFQKNAKTVYRCPQQNYKNPCPETFDTPEESNYHFHHVHGSRCPHKKCDFANRDIRIVERHMKAVHNSNLWSRCKICHEKITGVDEFDKHLEFSHNKKIWSTHLGLKEMERIAKKLESKLE